MLRTGLRETLPVAALIAYPLIAHLLILLEMPGVAVAGLVAVSVWWLLASLRQGPQDRLGLGVPAIVGLWGVINLLTDSVHVIFVPSIMINLSLAAFVATSLRTGNVPFLERFLRITHPQELPGAVRREARVLTGVWVGFFAAMAALSLALAVFAPLWLWSWFANIFYFVFIAALIIGMHTYQHFRFRRHDAAMSWDTVKGFFRLSLRDPAHPFFGYGAGARK